MYCNATEIAQTHIRIDLNIYSCDNDTVAVSCPKTLENSTIINECLNKTMECDVKDLIETTYCTNGTLISKSPVVCNSTTVVNGTNANETTIILNCYPGSIPEALASSIPTTTTEAQYAQYFTTTEKSLSIGAHIHIFFMKMIGKSDILKKAQATTTTSSPIEESPRYVLKENETLWLPEALTIPPDSNLTTTLEEESNLETTTLEPESNLTATTFKSGTTKSDSFAELDKEISEFSDNDF